MKIEVIDLNENQWAVIGDTTDIAESLNKFAQQGSVELNGVVVSGWIVAKEHTEKLNNTIPE